MRKRGSSGNRALRWGLLMGLGVFFQAGWMGGVGWGRMMLMGGFVEYGLRGGRFGDGEWGVVEGWEGSEGSEERESERESEREREV